MDSPANQQPQRSFAPLKHTGRISNKEAWGQLLHHIGRADTQTITGLRQLSYTLLEPLPRHILIPAYRLGVEVAEKSRELFSRYSTVNDVVNLANKDVLDTPFQEEAYTAIRPHLEQTLNTAMRLVGNLDNYLHVSVPSNGIPVARNLVLLCAADELIGFGPIDPLWRDPWVAEVSVNGPYDVQVHHSGKLYPVPSVQFTSRTHLKTFIGRALRSSGHGMKALSQSQQIVSGFVGNKNRIHVVGDIVCPDGPQVSLRKASERVWTPADMVESGAISQDAMLWLGNMAFHGASMLIAGGSGAGKTTLLSALLSSLPDNIRGITMEDNLELPLNPRKLWAPAQECLLNPPEKQTGRHGDDYAIPMRALVRSALRSTPDAIIPGETLDGAALDVLRASDSGHICYTTMHADTAENALMGMQTLALQSQELDQRAAAELVRKSFELVVHIEKPLESNRRFITAIGEIVQHQEDPRRLEIRPIWSVRYHTDENGQLDATWEQVGELSPERVRKLRIGLTPPLTWDELVELSEVVDPYGSFDVRDEWAPSLQWPEHM